MEQNNQTLDKPQALDNPRGQALDNPRGGPVLVAEDMPASVPFFGNKEAHANFMSETPKVMNEHKSFINNLTKIPESTEPAVTEYITNLGKDDEKQNDKKLTPTNNNASICSEYVPIVNHINRKDEDDDNNNSKLIDLLISSSEGSVLAKIELNKILKQMEINSCETEVYDNNYAHSVLAQSSTY